MNRRTYIVFFIFILPVIFLFTPFTITLSGGDEDKTVETVVVTDFEVPVRVFHNKKLVDNLGREDFLLFEDNVPQKINGFYITRKKITLDDESESSLTAQENDPRYFVLVFKITEFNDQLKEGIDFLFNKLLRKTDQLLIFINEKTFFLNDLKEPEKARQVVSDAIQNESVAAKHRLSRVLDKIESELSLTKFNQLLNSRMAPPAQEIITFLENYILIWDEYRKKYLTPSVDDYYGFARYLEKIDMEKWVINFYQIEMFPKLKSSGEMMEQIRGLIADLQASSRSEDVFHSRTMSNLLMKINISLNAATDFPAEEISKLFYKVNTVFHSVFIRTSKTVLSQDIDYQRVSTNLENSFREITERTGGELISSGDITGSVKKLTGKEDILYMLTYAPDEGKKVGKIRVETKNPDYTVIYDNNMRDKYIERYFRNKDLSMPSVVIEDMKLAGKTLEIKIKDYFFRMENGRRLGKMRIHIVVKDDSGRSFFDQEKTIVADKSSFTIRLNLNNLVPGEYSVVTDVLDLLTDRSDMKYLKEVYRK